ncbi:N-acetyl-gamma-glutamyl-phosphate reductase [Rubritalea marina]|uniref:N-acetyl-gamma-glutamyl-phosphate reductase n=1 Tax=Rubritalea marina TaxID=361055 RepID=UPI000379B7AF|nr:N-acetyl-gamma-glutamyl-phosphate reductase [Rubritalea marina]
MQRIKVAVIGASGYTGMELLRLLLMHPHAELSCVTSRQYAGQPLSEVFPRFAQVEGSDLPFIEPDAQGVKESGASLAFLALPHGVAAEYAKALLALGIKVIDLSADFRLNDPAVYEEFYGDTHPAPELLSEAVYGMPELPGRSQAITTADLVASPGCYPTSIILPLVPLLAKGLIEAQSIVTCSMSGVSGAGKTSNQLFSYCEANESVRAYGAPKHRHLSEIEQELSLAAGAQVRMSFTPHLVPAHNGICTTSSALSSASIEEITEALESAYSDCDFVRLLGPNKMADTKNVTRTNFIDIGWALDERTGRVLLFSAEDNLGKGAASQAVQSFNLMCELETTSGLQNL